MKFCLKLISYCCGLQTSTFYSFLIYVTCPRRLLNKNSSVISQVNHFSQWPLTICKFVMVTDNKRQQKVNKFLYRAQMTGRSITKNKKKFPLPPKTLMVLFQAPRLCTQLIMTSEWLNWSSWPSWPSSPAPGATQPAPRNRCATTWPPNIRWSRRNPSFLIPCPWTRRKWTSATSSRSPSAVNHSRGCCCRSERETRRWEAFWSPTMTSTPKPSLATETRA